MGVGFEKQKRSFWFHISDNRGFQFSWRIFFEFFFIGAENSASLFLLAQSGARLSPSLRWALRLNASLEDFSQWGEERAWYCV